MFQVRAEARNTADSHSHPPGDEFFVGKPAKIQLADLASEENLRMFMYSWGTFRSMTPEGTVFFRFTGLNPINTSSFREPDALRFFGRLHRGMA